MYELERVIDSILIIAIEAMNNEMYKSFITTQLDELDRGDFLEVIEASENSVNLSLYSKDVSGLTENIRDWHADRKITVNGNSITQCGKLVEELSELILAIQRKDKPEVIDAIGDMYVVMVAIAELEGTSMYESIESAYIEIKDRRGVLDAAGNFIREKN